MELKFVEDEIVAANRGQNRKYPWAEFIEELYKHPNRWAEFPMKINNSITGYRVQETYKDIVVKLADGNNLAAAHPDKQYWTVYLRYEPSITVEELF